MNQRRVFLTAEWRWLAVLNWPAPASLLKRHLPAGVELDLWQDQAYASIVGFMFRKTKVCGWAVPWHREFAELNLRFYVRRPNDPASRGVCFVREVVPRRAVSWVARLAYNENYVTCPMRCEHGLANGRLGLGSHATYSWKYRDRWNCVAATVNNAFSTPLPGSAEAYFIENYWGYCSQRDGSTAKYRVTHPPWLITATKDVTWQCDVANMYGQEWLRVLGGQPESAYVIEGSDVQVYTSQRII